MWRAALAFGVSFALLAGPSGSAAARQAAPLLAMVGNGTTESVAWLDASSLRPVASRAAVYVGLHDIPHAFSPDGSLLALGSGRTGSLVVVDLKRMRAVGRLASHFTTGVAWVSGRRLVIVESRQAGSAFALTATVVAVDATGVRVVARHALPSAQDPIAFSEASRAAVLLLAPRETMGAPMLAVIRPDGVRTRTLDRLAAGVVPPDLSQEHPLTRYARPGLAVDAAGGRGFVVPGSGPVGEVDLTSLAVTYHELSSSRHVEALAKGGNDVLGEGWSRHAIWLGAGRIAVTGADEWVEEGVDGLVQRSTNAGLRVIDTATWSERTLDEHAEWLAWTRRFLVGVSSEPRRLAVYDRDGGLRFSRPLGADGVQVAGRRVYLTLGNEYRRHRVRIVDLDSERTVRTVTVPGWFYPLNRPSPELCWC